MSLAGRTASPAAQPVPVRVGGFGGADGLASYLADEQFDVLIDATHPYAAAIAESAALAAQTTKIPLLALRRPPWTAQADDRWTEVADIAGAIHMLGERPKSVFLAIGRKNVAAFAQAPQHKYLVRSVDPVDPPLVVPHAEYITGRGPFSEAHDRELLKSHRIDVVISKNSGGDASYGKIAAARALGVAVVLLKRPVLPDVPAASSIDTAMAWLDHALASAALPAANRGV